MQIFQRSTLFAAVATLATADTVINGIDVNADWKAPVAGDVRTPCPLLNAIANHGFVNRDGYNITKDQLIPVLRDIVGFDQGLSEFLFEAGTSTTKNPNGSSFDFKDVNQHDLLEHDGSLSRSDYFFGDAVSFSPEAFAQTKSYFTTEKLDLQQTTAAHVSRMNTSNTTNPSFGLTPTGDFNSLGETLLYMSVLGPKDKHEVDRERVEYFFEQERLPFVMGWKPEPNSITGDFVEDGIHIMMNITGRHPADPGDDNNNGDGQSQKRHVVGKRHFSHFGKAFSL